MILEATSYGGVVCFVILICVLMESMSGVLSGSMARVFLHELDHLDGVLYTERMIPSSFTHTSLLDKHVMVDGIQHAEAALAAGLISEISAGTGSGNGRD